MYAVPKDNLAGFEEAGPGLKNRFPAYFQRMEHGEGKRELYEQRKAH